MSTAIVTGATGILGRAVVQELAKDAEKWPTIHAISRSQKEQFPATVKHRNVDLLRSPSEIAEQLHGIEADYVFFNAYVEKETEQALWDANGALLRNFLEALSLSGADKKLKRVVLPVGGKQYGIHFGPIKLPSEETDPRVDGPEYPPNFYYLQQDILKEMSTGKPWDWVVTIPGNVVGFARGNFMNMSTALALYSVVTHELGEDFLYPGNEKFYLGYDCFTSSKLHAQFALWAALEPKCSNQLFNISNGDIPSWQSLWPKLAAHFGCTIPADQFSRPAPLPFHMQLLLRPPLALHAASIGIEGRVEPGAVDERVHLLDWAHRPEVRDAWAKIAAREELDVGAFERATWQFAGFVLGRRHDGVLSMSKARKYGWTGYIDTWDSLVETFEELEREKIIPKVST